MPAEVSQELGRAGTQRVKRLLEATLRFNLPYNAYEHSERVRVRMLTGAFEMYDLTGDYRDEDGTYLTQIFVESKNLTDAGSQSIEFRRFLAQAYSATKLCIDEGADPKYEFMWATTCPWKGDGFTKITTEDEIRSATEWDRDRNLDTPVAGSRMQRVIPDGHTVDDSVLRLVAPRLWVWVVSTRHEDMTMGTKMRSWVHERLVVEGLA